MNPLAKFILTTRTCPKMKVTLPKNWMTLFGTPTMMFVKRAQINVNDEMTQLPLWTNSTLTMQQETSLTTISTMKIPTQQRMTRMFSITTLTTNRFHWNRFVVRVVIENILVILCCVGIFIVEIVVRDVSCCIVRVEFVHKGSWVVSSFTLICARLTNIIVGVPNRVIQFFGQVLVVKVNFAKGFIILCMGAVQIFIKIRYKISRVLGGDNIVHIMGGENRIIGWRELLPGERVILVRIKEGCVPLVYRVQVFIIREIVGNSLQILWRGVVSILVRKRKVIRGRKVVKWKIRKIFLKGEDVRRILQGNVLGQVQIFRRDKYYLVLAGWFVFSKKLWAKIVFWTTGCLGRSDVFQNLL